MAIGLFACIAFYGELVGNLPAQWLVDPLSILAAAGAVAVASVLTAACDRRVEAWQQREKQIMADESDSKRRNSGTPHQQATHDENLQAILQSPSYRIAAYDTDFLHREELRPVRLQLELLKPEMAFQENGIRSTVVVFGGTQIVDQEEADRRKSEADTRLELAPDDQARTRDVARAERIRAKAKYYDQAREFGRIVSSACQVNGDCDYVVITGGGPGVMEAANRGAFDAGAKSIGLNITLPAEQRPNPYISPELCFQFHYFALRKMHFLMRAKALVVFPGGFGTLDELFDALTLRQTQRMQEIPIILFGREYWDR
ncbi:MAG: LOG family protein, partial [Planctomycetales bacterium]|nr:LOG family protein [Planctomycetales bacterium]